MDILTEWYAWTLVGKNKETVNININYFYAKYTSFLSQNSFWMST